jgi:hypothetical protein
MVTRMKNFSKYIHDEIEAHNAIVAIEDAKELQAFIKGEQRDHLLDLAAFRLNALKSAIRNPQYEVTKQGEQAGPFTKPVTDFKEGIQGAKGVDSPEPRPLTPEPKSYITLEDVLAAQRKEGREI